MSKSSKNKAENINIDDFSVFDSFQSFDFDQDFSEDTSHESLEEEAKAEVTEYQLAIREASANTQKSLEQQWNTDFYFCAFFASQEQRDEFLKKVGALGLIKDNFINGPKLAELLGIPLTEQIITVPKLFAPKTDWFDITNDF